MPNVGTYIRACFMGTAPSGIAITVGSELHPEFNRIGIVAVDQRGRRCRAHYGELSAGGHH
jgi:hypothetical protein